MADERELIERSRDGDAAAFEQLYRATCGRVHAVALRMSADSSAAEEITQETFIRAWRSLRFFRGESRFTTWLHSIAVSTAVDHSRRKQRRERDVIDEHPISHPSIDTKIDLGRAIDALPTGARHVLVLHDVFGYRYDEIAARLGIALGTVKSQLHRARALILKEVSHGPASD